ncbi:MAG: hypothetical protein O7F12_05215 [Nitrospirae bacterium]|nr:hypothetical protein [Nitrospirota bacterium]
MKFFTNQRRFLSVTTGTLVGVYLALSCMALFCSATHSSHHKHSANHSQLCTWVCQGNNPISMATLPAPDKPILMTSVAWVLPETTAPVVAQPLPPSRAPPLS